MGSQIKFFNKNRLDLSNDDASIEVTDLTASNDGQEFVDFMRNRNNRSAWLTTGSNDAALTQIDVNLGIQYLVTDIMLLKHNLGAYTIQYWDGFSYVDFPTAINETTNTETSTNHEFTETWVQEFRIIIQGTIVADEDKKISQLIITDKLASGQLKGWPKIRKPTHNTNKRVSRMLSGKVNVVESIGGFSMDLTVSNWNIDVDLELIEEIYFGRRAVLVLLSGSDETQFSHVRVGYRNEDLYFMRAVNDYIPEWNTGIYVNGLNIKLSMAEARE